jgi:arylsulfatase A-like enzyme/Tfp pilus assembly protein PilF
LARSQRPKSKISPTPPRGDRRRSRWGAVALFVVAIGGGAYWLAAWRGWLRAPGPLNVLVITVDTTRADALGCYGQPGTRTPNIDRLAREGTLFTRCTTCSPLTLPSHASIFTSLYPYAHGARHNGTGRLAESNVTLAETLRAAGFRTQATVASFVLDRKFGTNQGFEVYHDVTPTEPGDERNARRPGNVVCDDALSLLRAMARERFFLWVHFYDAHYPYISARNPDRESQAAYEDQISSMDAQIGRLLDGLTQLGLDRRTLVVLVADHGEAFGEHGERMHGSFVYETTLHTPLILRAPRRIPAGRKVTAQVRTIDVAPTILALAGLPAWSQAQGVSLVPLLAGQTDDLKLAAYSESLMGQALFESAALRSLTSGGWKYIHVPRPELYDLTGDPSETRNLVDANPVLVEALRGQMHDLLAAAPPPPAKEERAVALGAAERATLQSLGYAAAPPAADEEATPESERFEPRGADPKDCVRWFELSLRAAGALQNKDFARAQQMLSEVVAALPNVAGLRLELAQAWRDQGRMPEADQEYRQALALAPHNGDARQTYGRFLLYTAKRYKEAAEQLGVALAQAPDDVNLQHDLAVAWMALGQLDKAEQLLQLALRLEPDNPRVTQGLGVLRMQQTRFTEAREYFRRTLVLNPDSLEAQAALQWLSQRKGP